MQLRVSLAAQ